MDLKERVEELEHRCVQLSGETDTIGNVREMFKPIHYSALYLLNISPRPIKGVAVEMFFLT